MKKTLETMLNEMNLSIKTMPQTDINYFKTTKENHYFSASHLNLPSSFSSAEILKYVKKLYKNLELNGAEKWNNFVHNKQKS